MRKLLYFLYSLVMMSMLGACGNSDIVDDDSDSTAIKLGVLPTMECLPFYYADSTGLFDSLGMNVKLVTFDAAMDADTAFKKGHIDGIVSDLVKACVWKGEGDSVRIVMGADMKMWLVTAQNARILKVESIKDKIIGSTRNSAEDLFCDKLLEYAKLKPLDLNTPQINKIKLRTMMVDQNQYDGAVLPEPFASEAVARGGKRVVNSTNLRLANMMCVVFNDSTIKKKKEIQKLSKVYDLAVDELNNDTTLNILGFFPKENILFVPDTLFTFSPLKPSAMPSDSLKGVVKKWAEGRGFIK